MNLIWSILLALIIATFPAAAIWGAKKNKLVNALGPVVLCYLAGIALANVRLFPLDAKVAQAFTEGTVIIAIPLLLYSTNFIKWMKISRPTVISFGLSIVSVSVVATAAAFLFSHHLPESNKIAGMFVGVYTGGTPNMNAIGLALNVPNDTFVLVNGADVVVGAIYYLFLMTLAKPLLSRILPPFDFSLFDEDPPEENMPEQAPEQRFSILQIALSIALAVLICLASVGISFLFTGSLNVTLVILTLTSLGIAASFYTPIRRMSGAYETGQYLLLMFCVAIGTLADIDRIMEVGALIFGYCILVVVGSILVHFALAAVLRIDVDTVIITSTAAIFGPPFVGPIAGVLKNRHVVVSGLTTGLVGLAVGNYLGIGLAMLLEHLSH